jgi:beta-amylase
MGLIVLLCIVAVHSIPVYVMLPLNSVNNDGSLNMNLPWDNWFNQLRNGGVAGVMGDVWWGIVCDSWILTLFFVFL